jgi:hypothetical protein
MAPVLSVLNPDRKDRFCNKYAILRSHKNRSFSASGSLNCLLLRRQRPGLRQDVGAFDRSSPLRSGRLVRAEKVFRKKKVQLFHSNVTKNPALGYLPLDFGKFHPSLIANQLASSRILLPLAVVRDLRRSFRGLTVSPRGRLLLSQSPRKAATLPEWGS